MNDFPPNYAPPKQSSNYLKLENEDTKVRIMKLPSGKPFVIGYKYEDVNGDRYFFRDEPKVKENEIKEDKFGNRKVQHFWLGYVWSYDEECFKIWEITQSSIQTQLFDYSNNEDWGSVTQYDINIKRKEENIVKYTLQPSPKIQPVRKEIQDEFDQMEKVDFEKKFEEKNPVKKVDEIVF
jgi:hypothetical protein